MLNPFRLSFESADMVKSNGKGTTDYETKFADFIKMLAETEADIIIIHNPNALGDTYEEIVQSLNRLGDADKSLKIIPRKERKKSSAKR